MSLDSDDYRPPKWRWPLTFLCIALYALGCWVQTCGGEQVRGEDHTDASTEAPETLWVTDSADGGSIARPMPKDPLPGQAHPPCGKRDVALNGGCWREMAKPPDPGEECGPDEYLMGGRCYLPVRQARRPPTSMDP